MLRPSASSTQNLGKDQRGQPAQFGGLIDKRQHEQESHEDQQVESLQAPLVQAGFAGSSSTPGQDTQHHGKNGRFSRNIRGVCAQSGRQA